jgi:hypothetical protein
MLESGEGKKENGTSVPLIFEGVQYCGVEKRENYLEREHRLFISLASASDDAHSYETFLKF